MAVRSVACPVHVGREAEIAALEASAAALTRGGRTVLIGGEAGVGKSRMAAEAVRIAERLGAHVLVGACEEGAGTAYAPVVAALRRDTRTLGSAELAALFDGPARVAATILPEVAESIGAGSAATTAPEDLDAAMWHLLHRMGAKRTVVLLVEDLHWAGPDTLRMLSHLAREAPTLPLWLLTTYRVDELHRRHPLTPVLAALRRLPGVDDLVLRPLDREQQRSMLSALFGGTSVGDEFLDAVRGRTAGNPFFVEELSAALVERGDIYSSGTGDWNRRALDDIEMPLTVREALLARAGRMSEEAQQVLRIAAVVGESVDDRVLQRATELPQASVDAAVVAALERQLLVERRDQGRAHYAFRHALVREALLDDMVGPERRAAHARVADALESVHGDDLDSVSASLAVHWEEAGDAEKARVAALRAARRAARDRAPVAATGHFDHVLRLMHDDDPERVAVLLEAAAGTYTDHDRAAATGFAREARRIAHEAGDPVAEAEAMRWLWQDRWRSGDSDGAGRLSEEAWRLVEGRGDATEARCLAALVRHLVLTGRRAGEARALLPRAEEVARHAGRDDILSMVFGSRALLAPNEEENLRATEEAVRLARAGGSPDQEYNALINGGYTSLWLGAMERAVAALRGGLDLVERVLPGRVAYTRAGLAWALAVTGALDEALAHAGPLVDCADVPARMVALTALAEVALTRGDLDAAVALASDNDELARRSGEGQRIDPARSHLTRARLRRDGPDAALEAVEMVLSRTWLTDGQTGCHAWVSPDLSRALRRLEESARLARLAAILEELTEHDPTRNNRTALLMVQGDLALMQARPADAARTFEQAARAFAALPYPVREAEARLSQADALLAVDDLAGAVEASRAARAVAERLGAPWLREAADVSAAHGERELVLATVMVTDIVDSTTRAAALGDRAWRALLERHHAIVRRELERHRGREVDTAGDGFLAVFDSPARAIRCALGVVEALAPTGLVVRVGLHTGECEVLGDKLAGIAVHTASRVAASAAAGEVLVTATVRDLVAGGGFRFETRGTGVVLRGVPGEWSLLAVAGRV